MLRKSATGRLFDQRFGPTEVFDFTKGVAGQIKGTALTCSGGVNGTVIDQNGNTVAASAPRITYDPVGITNWCLQSEALNVFPWTGNPSVTVASETYLGSPFWTIAKTLGSANETELQQFRAMGAGDSAACTLALLAGTSAAVALGFYGAAGAWGLDANATAEILAGPGTLTRQIGAAWQVTNLSATVPTVLAMRRVYPSTDTQCSLYIYPGLSSSTTIGHSIKVARPMVEFNVAKPSIRYAPTTTLPVTIRDCLGLLVEKASTNKVTQSQASTGFVAAGTTPPTVTPSVTYMGEVSTHILFQAGSDVGYAGCRASRTGNQFVITAGQPISSSIGIALNRALTGSEQVVYYPTGASGGFEWVLTASNSAQFVGRWVRIELPNMTMVVTGYDYANFHVKNVLGSPLSLYVCKEQNEDGDLCTSYIPTAGSTVTRSQDNVEITGSAVAAVFNPTAGTMLVESSIPRVATATPAGLLTAINVTPGSVDWLSISRYPTYPGVNRRRSSVDLAGMTISSTHVANTVERMALAYRTDGGNDQFAMNGTLATQQASSSTPYSAVDTIRIGRFGSSPGWAGGTIRKACFWGTALSDSQLQALTTL